MPRSVDVIVPVKDDPRVADCVRALLAQDHPADLVTIYVADNGSAAPPRHLESLSPRVVVLEEPRPGSYAARNAALRTADGDVVAFTDSDCLPDPSWLSEAVRALDSGVDVVAGHVEVYPRDARRPHPVEAFEMLNAFRQDRSAAQGWAVTANVVVPRTVLDEVGEFNADLPSGGDAEWCHRAVAAGHPPVYVPSAVVRHPARGSYTEAWTKLRRVADGRRRRVALGENPPGGLSVRSFTPPLGSAARAVRTAKLRTPRAKAAYVVGAFWMTYARVGAALHRG
ncbi:glycosyltransferase [Kineococcus gynurae]|uniref:Glycosyltransferase n=1 Tax=Kineococcus gynurae TaxID=452979 RepID=A0ABV5LWP4_9ACTN